MRERTVLASLLLIVVFALGIAASATCQERRGTIEWKGPRQTPAEAAAVLRACACPLTNMDRMPAPLPEGPTVGIVGGRPGALAWLDFPWPGPRIRLDGTPIWLPPTTYGSQIRYPVRRFGTFPRSEVVPKGGPLRQEPGRLHQARRSQ